MNILSHATDLVRGFRRALGITGEGGVDSASPLLHPVLNLWDRPEWALLRGEYLADAYYFYAAGGAGKRAMIQLWNPSDSRRIGILTALHTSVAESVLSWHNAALTDSITSPRVADSRTVGAFTGADHMIRLQLRGTNQSATGVPGTGHQIVPTAGKHYWTFVIGPGTGLVLGAAADNTTLLAGFCWYERDALPGEHRSELI